MNIIFKTVKTKNFMSLKDFEFDFSAFQGQNVLIYGVNEDIKGDTTRSNGSGKSTIMNTLIFSLYGDILNSVKKLGHIRNWKCGPKDDVSVALTLESNGCEYTIERYLRGKKGEQELHVYKRGDNGEDCEEITLSTIAETQRMIENDIILCGKDGFLRCILLTADQNYNFFKLNKAAKNQFFESLFELTVYSDMYNRLHRKTLDENASLLASSRTIDSLNANILKIEQDKENDRKNRESIKNAKEKMEKARQELEDFTSSTDVDSEIERIKTELADGREKMKIKLDALMKTYDAKHGAYKVDSDGNILFSKSDEESAVNAALEKFDEEHDISLDDDGNIVFAENGEYEQIVSKGNEIKNRISKGSEMLATVEEAIQTKKDEIRSVRNDIECGERRIRSMEMTLKTHSKITDILCEDCLGKYKKSVNINDFDSEMASIRLKNEEYAKSIDEYNSEIEEQEKLLKKYRDAMDKLNRALSELREEASNILSSRKSLQSEREICRKNAIMEVRVKHREIQAERNEYRTVERSKLAEEYAKVEKRLIESRDILLNTLERLKREVSDAESNYNTLSASVSKIFDASIMSLKESLESAKSEFYEHTSNLAHYKSLEEILKPDNIRKSVVADMLRELNFRICGYLSKMGSNYTCKFDEDFDATFVSSVGNETEYNNFSSGEKMRLGIACCLAFRDFMQVRLNLHPNILAIDEYIDSNLDPMAVNGIMDMIHYMVGTEKIAAFIISHRSEVMQDMFDSEIMVRKKDNESKIVVNGQ